MNSQKTHQGSLLAVIFFFGITWGEIFLLVYRRATDSSKPQWEPNDLSCYKKRICIVVLQESVSPSLYRRESSICPLKHPIRFYATQTSTLRFVVFLNRLTVYLPQHLSLYTEMDTPTFVYAPWYWKTEFSDNSIRSLQLSDVQVTYYDTWLYHSLKLTMEWMMGCSKVYTYESFKSIQDLHPLTMK